MITKTLLFTLAGFIILGSIFVYSNLNNKIYSKANRLHLSNKEISLMIVSNNQERIKGLSGTESLDKDKAMLFVFDNPGSYGIWMKDMKYPLDIFWLDDHREIVSIENNIKPDTYPKVFYPKSPSVYVIEANAGFAKENNLEIGKVMDFDL